LDTQWLQPFGPKKDEFGYPAEFPGKPRRNFFKANSGRPNLSTLAFENFPEMVLTLMKTWPTWMVNPNPPSKYPGYGLGLIEYFAFGYGETPLPQLIVNLETRWYFYQRHRLVPA